jgi:hypothetical protein
MGNLSGSRQTAVQPINKSGQLASGNLSGLRQTAAQPTIFPSMSTPNQIAKAKEKSWLRNLRKCLNSWMIQAGCCKAVNHVPNVCHCVKLYL